MAYKIKNPNLRGRQAPLNPLENREAKRIFILIRRGVSDTEEIANLTNKQRPTIYDNVRGLKEKKIIEKNENKAGFKVGRNAKRYEKIYIKDREKKINKLKKEIDSLKN